MLLNKALIVATILLTASNEVQCQSSALETLLLSIEAGVTKQAKIAQEDYDIWACGGNPLSADSETCYVDGCKGNVQNPTCTSSGKDAFGGCNADHDYVVVDYDKTRITFATNPSTQSTAVQTEVSSAILHFSGQDNLNKTLCVKYVIIYETIVGHVDITF